MIRPYCLGSRYPRNRLIICGHFPGVEQYAQGLRKFGSASTSRICAVCCVECDAISNKTWYTSIGPPAPDPHARAIPHQSSSHIRVPLPLAFWRTACAWISLTLDLQVNLAATNNWLRLCRTGTYESTAQAKLAPVNLSYTGRRCIIMIRSVLCFCAALSLQAATPLFHEPIERRVDALARFGDKRRFSPSRQQ